MALHSSTTVVTGDSHRYMAQLCRHFAHRVPATLGERESRIAFASGEVYLRASPATLMILAEAGAADALAQLEGVVERHLKRFAFREPNLAVEWRRAPAI